MLFRLALALILSFGLAVLLAWGWDRSDAATDPAVSALQAESPALGTPLIPAR